MSRILSARTLSRSLLLLTLLNVSLATLIATTSVKDEPVENTKTSKRYLTHVSTDKQIYRPSETVYIRTVLLDHISNRPLPKEALRQVTFNIKDPKGNQVHAGRVNVIDSVAGFKWTVPAEQTGGEYTLAVEDPASGTAAAERKFDVRVYRAPRLKSQIKFLRDGYGAGDEVVAMLNVERAEGGFPENAVVTVTGRVDGSEIFRGAAKVDQSGNCTSRFQLPNSIERGEGTVSMTIEDGGVIETATKTIPILLQTIDLTFYPEGGDLLSDRENRVYFEAFTPTGKPADLAGVVLDGDGNQVAQFRSEHEGRGRFALTPDASKEYTVKVTEPSGIDGNYSLPKVSTGGATIACRTDAFATEQAIELQVRTVPEDLDVTVRLSKQDRVLGKVKPEDASGDRTATFQLTEDDPDGVLIATVFDADGKPLAERLIYRQPAHSINIDISPDSSSYTPGSTASVNVTTTDEDGNPISALVGISVTDDSVLEMTEKREQAPHLPVMVLLEADVRELADATVYLDPGNPGSARAVDLLLGTQGWRRFAFLNVEQFIKSSSTSLRALPGQSSGFPQHWGMPMEGRPMGLEQALQELPKKAGAPKPAAEKNKQPVAEEAQLAKPVQHRDKQLRRIEKEDSEVGMNDRGMGGKMEGDDIGGIGDIGGMGGMGMGPGMGMWRLASFRVFAHHVRAGRIPGERFDFTETLYWNAGIRTDESGKANFKFGLSDAVTEFRILADAFAENGSLGSQSLHIESVEPFYIEPTLPLEVTAGDQIRLPIGIVNSTLGDYENVTLEFAGHETISISNSTKPFTLENNSRLRQLVDLSVGNHNGEVEFTVGASAGEHSDRVSRKLTVRPRGFPIRIGEGGLLAPDSSIHHKLEIPKSIVDNSLQMRVAVYPSPLANLTEALEALIREPCGCFEQTSSSVYPLIMAQQYFKSHQGVNPDLISRSSEILDGGYERLTSFECPGNGFEWFGKDPGHDALTAYGLMEFTDMATVRPVDISMLSRTRKWLLDQRDGDGGFKRKTNTLHTWLAEPEIANSYNTWALLEAKVDADLSTEIQWVRDAATTTSNSYVLALAANVMLSAGKTESADSMLSKLSQLQNSDGSIEGATQSVVGSQGNALAIETTALATLAWLKNQRYTNNVEKSIRFLAESCKSGRFGSTQSTVLALKAIVAYDKSRSKPKAAGSLQLMVDGKAIGEPVAFDASTQGAIALPDAAKLLTPGEHSIELTMTDGAKMPYAVSVDYHCLTPESADDCNVNIEVSLSDRKVEEGTTTEANVVIANQSEEAVSSPIAIVGIPGGLEVRHDQLKELVSSSKIAAYEVRGREVVLYWRMLEPKEQVKLQVSLLAAIPGSYAGPASRAYLYYTDEHKHWVEELKVEVQPKMTSVASNL